MEDRNHSYLPGGCFDTTAEYLEHLMEFVRCEIRKSTTPGRDQSIALTKIDEAEMWALRGL